MWHSLLQFVDLTTIILLLSLSAIAFCYAAVGHGGASGYIAIFALFGLLSPQTKSFVLVMNLIVASITFIHYSRKGYFNIKYFLPFALGAAPMAYFGAKLKIDAALYHYILAAFLFFSVSYLLGFFNKFHNLFQTEFKIWKSLMIGAVIGFFSGIVGVGGGIFLSPVLLILGWQNLKQTASLSALFIVVNSASGLLAIKQFDSFLQPIFIAEIFTVALFGYLGGKWGVNLENTDKLKKMLAFVLLIAGIKLCLT
ncbi:MAG: sulfite exporter TauE/SafE family protein [Bacteroidia bacterium]|nr:sulfite exporter TauE/SafE family protein [Bacteroidia bacterium]